MRADGVVPEPEFGEGDIQCFTIRHAPAIEFLCQGQEKPFDAAVLPRAMQLGGLLPNAQQFQAELKEARGEHRFVVGANVFRPAIFETGLADGEQQRQRALVRQRFQMQIKARAVIHDAEDRILPTTDDRLTRQINTPGVIFATGFPLAAANPMTHVRDLVGVPFEDLRNVRLADGHVAFGGVQSIEDVGDIAAAQRRLQGLECDDGFWHPIRLAARAIEARYFVRRSAMATPRIAGS